MLHHNPNFASSDFCCGVKNESRGPAAGSLLCPGERTWSGCLGMSYKLPKIGIGGAFRLRPSHTTVRTGPYTAVREVALTRFDQGWETEQLEVGVGKPNREGFAPCDVPGATAASGRIEQFPRELQCDQRCTTATWCFPLTPQSGPQSQSDPTSESDQHLGRFAKAEIAAPTPHIRDQFFHSS